jgi:hypothetical protein
MRAEAARWLGRWSPKGKIRESGPWQVPGLGKELEVLKRAVE